MVASAGLDRSIVYYDVASLVALTVNNNTTSSRWKNTTYQITMSHQVGGSNQITPPHQESGK